MFVVLLKMIKLSRQGSGKAFAKGVVTTTAGIVVTVGEISFRNEHFEIKPESVVMVNSQFEISIYTSEINQ